jgi:ubiquinol-cytochrome c reductase cytochrome b subunit
VSAPVDPPRPSLDRGARGSGLVAWLDRRTGVRGLLHEALDEAIPGGARWAYVFGSGLIFLFVSQVMTGVFLALYYVPSADHAHTTVAYIVKEVTSGSFVRSLHAYGSSAMVVLLALHVGQTILFGSYKGTRELLWLAGCVLFALTLAMAFTGYLLPWDQKAYFATAVGTNVLAEVPLVGGWLQRLVRGGADMGTLTISRFFVAHVLLIPAVVFGVLAAHVFLFRKAGAAGPPTEPEASRAELFYPRQVLMDLGFAALLIAGLGVLATLVPAELGPEANPADTRFLPRPEWYYVPIFQWLKYWPGGWAVLGILVIPGVLALLFAGLPFLDRGPERRPTRRPVTVGGFAVAVLTVAGLGYVSDAEDREDPAIARQLAAQRDAVRAYMEEPFEPDEASASLRSAKTSLEDPQRARGKAVYEAQGCDGCHGSSGEGTDAGPPLFGMATKHPGDGLARLLRMPTTAMEENGMSPLGLTDVPDPDLAALVAYVNGLR